QLLVLHDRGTETLLLTLAILVLAGVLTVLSFVSGDFKQSQDGKNVDIDQHF
ncbi:MAG: phosphate-starvation-inducible protein PsiE, partial [Lacticaseibacillus paracasei]